MASITNGNRYLEYFLDTEVEPFTLEIPLELVQAHSLGKVLLACEEAVLDGPWCYAVVSLSLESLPPK